MGSLVKSNKSNMFGYLIFHRRCSSFHFVSQLAYNNFVYLMSFLFSIRSVFVCQSIRLVWERERVPSRFIMTFFSLFI